MIAYERKKQILELMRQNNRVVTVDQLCESLFASGATIRRDLKDLEESKLIHRTHGGAVLVEGSTSEDPLAFRETQNSVKKQVIADLAIRHVRDGMTIFLDSSSTVNTLAKGLEKFNNLKVITNGLKSALLLSEFKNVKVLCTGGSLRENSKSLVGLAAKEFISRYNADLAFLSCRGFSVENGASEASEDECYVKTQYLANSKKAILMCDTSKMNLDFMCRLAPLSEFYEVITEKKEINDLCNQYTHLHTRPGMNS
ncbi:DeoR/GlpR family DNA-binding transcription regulator [Caproiciproducens sp. LBM24188]|nr:DeoR/GlpR transcriptional regulator [Oscillospiraceae bacterium]HHV32642.1 DeoR/GlpR transcriptional regulator [Clostridiales bacterium]